MNDRLEVNFYSREKFMFIATLFQVVSIPSDSFSRYIYFPSKETIAVISNGNQTRGK